MLQQNPYAKYQEQNTMTASPGGLTLMLYDGCIKALRLGALFLNEKKLEDAHNELIRAQSIITELQTTLDMRYEVSQGLFALYDYMNTVIVQANMRKDAANLPDVVELLSEIREAWQQAVRENRRTGPSAQEA